MSKTNSRLLREILREETTLLLPGCYDALTAKILKQAGFPVLYMSGSAVTASITGKPDVGLLTMTEMVNQARNIVNATDLPLICDADTGYGNAINVIRTVKEYERVGVAGIHIEDQQMPKRCGHFEGKAIITAEEMLGKIKAAIYAREDEDFLIIARTDARAVLGLEEALRRARIYADGGADMLFIEAPQSTEEIEIIASRLNDIPLLINMVEGGKTPTFEFNYLKEKGVKIVLYPTTGIRIVMKALQEFALHLKKKGNTKELEPRMVSFEMRNKLLGLSEINELEEQFR
jgi:carboxyvinyl-carboxyphosphonate phosphorylmutase